MLRHENAVLRRQAIRVRYEPADRVWFAALARLIQRRRWTDIFPVTPATPAWHRKLAARKYDTSNQRRPGHPPTAPGIARLVKENPLWGHRRIHGELAKLGVTIAPSTVWETLHAAGIDPSVVSDVASGSNAGRRLWVRRSSSTSRDQAVIVDQATYASLSSDPVLPEIDRFG